MKNVYQVAGVVLGLLGATGCAKTESSNVNQSEIYTSYRISYHFDGNGHATDLTTPTLEIRAYFNLAGPTGTYLELDGQSQVAVNGKVLDKHEDDIINMVSYSYEKSAITDEEANQSYDLVYTDNDGKQYQNTLTLPPALQVTNASGSAYPLSQALNVSWSSVAAATTSETLTAYLEAQDGSNIASSSSGTTTGTAGNITISRDSMKYATAGSALLSVCRGRHSTPSQAPSAGGSLTSTRCSPRVAIILQ